MERRTPPPPLSENDRILIDAVRRSRTIEIRFGDDRQRSVITISSRGFSYDVSNALRTFVVETIKNKR